MPETVVNHILRRPNVCGGKACVAGRRVRVMDIAVWHERLSQSADEIVSSIPGLSLSDVYAALAYYYDNREEIEKDIDDEDRIAEAYRSRFPSRLKEKLNDGPDSVLPG